MVFRKLKEQLNIEKILKKDYVALNKQIILHSLVVICQKERLIRKRNTLLGKLSPKSIEDIKRNHEFQRKTYC